MLKENILENYIKNNLSKVFVKQKYSVGFLTVLVKIGKKIYDKIWYSRSGAIISLGIYVCMSGAAALS